MKDQGSLVDGILKQGKIWFIVIGVLFAYLFTGIDVKAQLQPPCVNSTPFCPCELENGDCFDIDTPIDNEVFILLFAGMLLGLYKLHSYR